MLKVPLKSLDCLNDKQEYEERRYTYDYVRSDINITMLLGV